MILIKLFGTSGIRGKYNDNLYPSFAYNLGKVLAVMFQKKNMRVVVGIDNRLSSKILEKALVCGLNSVGADVFLIGEVTTPCVSFAVGELKADIGVMITGSHKKEGYNGFKVFNGNGYKITDEEESFIENAIENSEDILEVAENELGNTFERKKIQDLYVNYVSRFVDNVVQNINVLIDTANGNSRAILEKLDKKLKIEIDYLENDKLNENGTNNITKLQEKLKQGEYDFGVAFDGDADRVLFLDKNGNVLDNDYVASAIIQHYKFKKIVLNSFSNQSLIDYMENNDKICKLSKVGEKYITETMLKHGSELGYEKIGHFIFRDIINTSDGVLAFIKFLNIYAINKNIFEDCKAFKFYPCIYENIECKKMNIIINNDEFNNTINLCESLCLENGKIIVRPSQIEQDIRLYVETNNEKLTKEIFEKIKNKIIEINN